MALFTLLCGALPQLHGPSGPNTKGTHGEKSNGICSILLGIQLFDRVEGSSPRWPRAAFASMVTTRRTVCCSWSCLSAGVHCGSLHGPPVPKGRGTRELNKMVSSPQAQGYFQCQSSSVVLLLLYASRVLKSLDPMLCPGFVTAPSWGGTGVDLLIPFSPEQKPYYLELNIVSILVFSSSIYSL